jgi:hypothetical protein
MRWCKVNLRDIALYCSGLFVLLSLMHECARDMRSMLIHLTLASNNTTAIEATSASVNAGRREFELFELLGHAPASHVLSCLFHFLIWCGVRCIDISKWPQSIVNSINSSGGEPCNPAVGERRNLPSRIACAARAMWELGRCSYA